MPVTAGGVPRQEGLLELDAIRAHAVGATAWFYAWADALLYPTGSVVLARILPNEFKPKFDGVLGLFEVNPHKFSCFLLPGDPL